MQANALNVKELEIALAKSREELQGRQEGKSVPELFKELEDKKMQKEEKLKQKEQKWEAKLADSLYKEKES